MIKHYKAKIKELTNIDVISVEFGYWATPRYETEFPRVAAGFGRDEM